MPGFDPKPGIKSRALAETHLGESQNWCDEVVTHSRTAEG
jgi:hypothetical protein